MHRAPARETYRRRRPGWLRQLAALAATVGLAGCAADNDPAARGGSPAPTACAAGAGAGGGVVVGSGVPGDPALPEPSSGYRLGPHGLESRHFMIVSANPLATQAGCEVLRSGGSAADAAVAVQVVLGLVEPQSSGLGGGTFVVYYDAASGTVQTYDGRETAPAAATENYLRHVGAADTRLPLPDPRASGRSIGTPGTVKLLDLLHQEHGRLPWAGLFDAGIRLATGGFAISGRLADAIARARPHLLRDPDAAAYFLHPDLSPKALGTPLTNPAYADTLARIAAGRSAAFYTGDVAADIVAEIRRTAAGPAAPGALTPGATTLADLDGYAAVKRAPVCIDYRAWRVCGMGPPSSGGIAVAQTLGILENFGLDAFPPSDVDEHGGKPSVIGVHLVSEAQRLAYADRNRYVADTDFVPLPGSGVASMLDKAYLRRRADLIRLDTSLGTAEPGRFAGAPAAGRSTREGKGTSQVTIVDAAGNALSMTTTIESSMGAYRFVRGFLLNNELTDFSFEPADADGPIANRVQPLKRPRSSMAPTLVFERGTGALVMATGSPGGSAIIQYVTKTVVAVLDWGLDAQQATSLANFGSSNGPTTGIGGEHPHIDAADGGAADPLVSGLRALGHKVSVNAQASGVSTIRRVPRAGAFVLQGGADPRREGLVLGD